MCYTVPIKTGIPTHCPYAALHSTLTPLNHTPARGYGSRDTRHKKKTRQVKQKSRFRRPSLATVNIGWVVAPASRALVLSLHVSWLTCGRRSCGAHAWRHNHHHHTNANSR